ncbi:alpha-ketoglutarate-dependent 2,4-dichlorophenoxyacetate dioxygenase [Pyrrhoderma noxium]|uniref:Alpha-ketoglutarate-dependent 2,4-dichlorophenoxyacetate dioxygenase n=1 Tax=Pyrrhoderma noxium TaxID=2282107 RepID=A0A286U809_9AGAM|nr:alpha-ketoglutarate-dependent 2,4-dichlorophenoxyacetate dioxygenase [Pyrrhoderma noxium]
MDRHSEPTIFQSLVSCGNRRPSFLQTLNSIDGNLLTCTCFRHTNILPSRWIYRIQHLSHEARIEPENASGLLMLTSNGFKQVKIGTLTCRPLHPTFGAEVKGVDFRTPVSEEVIRDIIAAQDKFGVTVYRCTGLDDDSLVAFSRQLGELERVYQYAGQEVRNPEIYKPGNTDEQGNIIKKGSRNWWFNKGNTLWHADSTFNQHRSKYSLLLAHIVPNEGGNTEFADERHAFRDLPEEKKQQLRNLVVKHNLWHSRKMAAPEIYDMLTEQEMNEKRQAYHKLVQKAPDGEETFYLASHGCEIVGMPKEEGLDLITELITYSTQGMYTISLKWKNPGDLIFWDNRQVMHRATPFNDQSDIRDLRRTTVYDDGPESFGVNIMS